MKIYSIAMFLLMVNLSLGLLVSADILPVEVETSTTYGLSYFEEQTNIDLTYSDTDINLFSFGDFLRSLTMLIKIFVMGPVLLGSLMSTAGMPTEISSIFMILTLAVYAVGVAQILMRYGLEGNS